MSVVVTVWGFVGMLYCVVTVVENSVFLALECMLCVYVADVMDVAFSVCILRREAVGARAWAHRFTMCCRMGTIACR